MNIYEFSKDVEKAYLEFQGTPLPNIQDLFLKEISSLQIGDQQTISKMLKDGLAIVVNATLQNRTAESILPDERLPYLKVTFATILGFFKKCERGETYGDPSIIKEKFGATLEENYGLSKGPFLRVAYAYWTFKLNTRSIADEYPGTVVAELIKSLEMDLASALFPTPGPSILPKGMREKAQRQILSVLAPDLDLEEFVSTSPILRAEKGSGLKKVIVWLVIALILIGIVIQMF